MRQPVSKGVVPLNTNPKWPEGYVAVLREVGVLELYYEQFRGIALDLRLDNVLPTTPSSISSRPAQEYEKPLSLIGHSAIEPAASTVDKYQTQPAPVNTVAAGRLSELWNAFKGKDDSPPAWSTRLKPQRSQRGKSKKRIQMWR